MCVFDNNKGRKMKTEKIFTFRVPADILATAHEIAAKQDLSLAQLLRRMLRELAAEGR